MGTQELDPKLKPNEATDEEQELKSLVVPEEYPVPFSLGHLQLPCLVCRNTPLLGFVSTDDSDLNIAICSQCQHIHSFSFTTVATTEEHTEVAISNMRLLQPARVEMTQYSCTECGNNKSVKKMRENNAVWECLVCNKFFFPDEVTAAANKKRMAQMTPAQMEDLVAKRERKRAKELKARVETQTQLKPKLAAALETIAKTINKQRNG